MNLGFDHRKVIDHLVANAPTLKKVQGAAEFAAAVKQSVVATPSAFVLMVKETPEPSTRASVVTVQKVEVKVPVVYAVRNYQVSSLGDATADDLLAVRREAFDALVGWKPTGYDQVLPAEFAGGQLLAYDTATVWWQDIFRIRYWSRT